MKHLKNIPLGIKGQFADRLKWIRKIRKRIKNTQITVNSELWWNILILFLHETKVQNVFAQTT